MVPAFEKSQHFLTYFDAGGADAAVKARRRVAADRLAAAAAEGRGHQVTFMGGKERAYFAQASSTAAVSRSSRGQPGPQSPSQESWPTSARPQP